MGSVGLGNNAQLGAFLNRTHPEGLDLGRCQIREALGVFVAHPTTPFSAGMLVMRDSNGLVVPSDGTKVLGVAKWNHATAMLAAAADEAVVLTGTTPAPLAHPNVSNVKVSASAGGAALVVGDDYTVNATNGTITRVNGGAISSGATVFVSYHYQLSQAQLMQTQGLNFWNNLDEVSQNEGRCAVITDAELLFTTQYDSSLQFTLGQKLYASTTSPGLIGTSSSGSAYFVGEVFQVPTASDPFLGFRLFKGPHS